MEKIDKLIVGSIVILYLFMIGNILIQHQINKNNLSVAMSQIISDDIQKKISEETFNNVVKFVEMKEKYN